MANRDCAIIIYRLLIFSDFDFVMTMANFDERHAHIIQILM